MTLPGFVDLQINGFAGVDFSGPDLTPDDMARVGEALLERGIVAYCPTLITSPLSVYERNLPIVTAAAESSSGARILGIHLEGPFLNPTDGPRGAHPLEHIAAPSTDLFRRLRDLADGRLSILTLAPDVDGAIDLIESAHADDPGLVIAMGHHLSDASTIDRACDAGARACVHVGNGLGEMIHRHLNPVWPMLADDRLTCFFISDGHHLPLDLLRVGLRAKGVERFIVTSDVVHLSGMAPGDYDFHGVAVVLEESGRLHLKDAYMLSGSACDMFDCMNVMASLGELNEAGLRRVGFDNPLRLLGLDPERENLPSGPPIAFDGRRLSLG